MSNKKSTNESKIENKEGLLCKKYLLDLDWDKAVAVSPVDESQLTSEDYTNFAYARCFQESKDHRDGSYDDVIEAASKALIKDDQNNRALCIRAYGYYLNNNYEAAIADCESVIKSGDIEEREKEKRELWKAVCEKITEAVKAEAAEATKEAEEAIEKYCNSLHDSAFAHELLGLIYTKIEWNYDASKRYKQALLYRQAAIVSSSPLLMDAYREARQRVNGG
ncbi:MAG: hypothetical protein LBH85_07730 [Treponema sp.]|jgi:tetratricopeptide (TPR) repeat protein|nr:hypothetical protein [Treponema sp.]